MKENSNRIEQVGRALGRLESDLEASECHGLVTGLICARGALSKKEWRSLIAPGAGSGDLLAGEALDELDALRVDTEQQLSNAVLDFHPLLPADSSEMELRIEALGDWCHGFLLGLAEGGIKDVEGLPPDSREIIKDMVEIARAGGYDLEGGEEDEEAYAQLLEYVRTGVLLINEELHPIKAPPRDDVTYH